MLLAKFAKITCTQKISVLQHALMCSKNKDGRQNLTRSQAVATIADSTASQHLRGSRDVIVT